MASDFPTVAVFAPTLFVTVTVEQIDDEYDDIHFHLGGQGYWVARMVKELGERPILCCPAGGEAGDVMRGLVSSSGLDWSVVRVSGSSPAYVHDRRNGDRSVIATSRPAGLIRHELDDLFGKVLKHALGAKVSIVTGRPRGHHFDPDFYRRLGADFVAAGVRSVGDFHGEELESFLSGGSLDILKVSDEDLMADGVDAEDDSAMWAEIDGLVERGVRTVVVSRGSRGAVASHDGRRYMASPPEFEVVDHTGAGDSMTAALAVGVARDLPFTECLAWACAAGAANVTRHGLGSASADLIGRLAEMIDVEELDG